MSKAKSANGQAFWDGLKSLLKGLFKLISVLLSWVFKLLAVVGEKLGAMFEKIASK